MSGNWAYLIGNIYPYTVNFWNLLLSTNKKYIHFIDLTKYNCSNIYIHEKFISELIDILKNSMLFRFNLLMDIFTVDTVTINNCFEINRRLISLNSNIIMIKSITKYEIQLANSCTNIYASASWLERENWDLFGIYFIKHNDLRRILTDYGFLGHPLRKDFPISGYYEIKYCDTKQRIIIEPIRNVQEFRLYDFLTPWQL